MKQILFRLLPPRPTFLADMTEAEAALMAQHVAYWNGLKDAGTVEAFAMGVVAHPEGPFGIGIFQLRDDADPDALAAADPTIRANVGFACEIQPMPRAIVRT